MGGQVGGPFCGEGGRSGVSSGSSSGVGDWSWNWSGSGEGRGQFRFRFRCGFRNDPLSDSDFTAPEPAN